MMSSPRPSCPLNLILDVAQITQIMLAVSKIQQHYFATSLTVHHKPDQTPVTLADQLSSELICSELTARWPWPALSEESNHPDWQTRKTWHTYWLIDPLDGTRDFIAGRPEFTINIALIVEGWPVFGFIWSAHSQRGWWGAPGHGAFAVNADGGSVKLVVSALPVMMNEWIVLSSHYVHSRQSVYYQPFKECQLQCLGSSLKFCRIATGLAHLYWRTGPTGEWDTAAGQALVEAAGGLVLAMGTLKPLRYNQKDSLINPNFVVASSLDARWQDHFKP